MEKPDIEEVIDALREMVNCAESQRWDNAEIHNAKEILKKFDKSC